LSVAFVLAPVLAFAFALAFALVLAFACGSPHRRHPERSRSSGGARDLARITARNEL
jgi:hypothetical protein